MSIVVKLAEDFYVVSGDKLTHTWDASAYLITSKELLTESSLPVIPYGEATMLKSDLILLLGGIHWISC